MNEFITIHTFISKFIMRRHELLLLTFGFSRCQQRSSCFCVNFFVATWMTGWSVIRYRGNEICILEVTLPNL